MKEYIVSVTNPAVWDTLWNELTTDGLGDNFVPQRQVEVVNERPYNDKCAHFNLTDEEAEELRNDPRIKHVELITDLRDGVVKEMFGIRSNLNFNKATYTINNTIKNWGLYRCTRRTNPFENTTAITGDFTYNLDGTGIDMIVVDSGVEPDHPEFAVNADGTGGSRVVDFNWYMLGVPGIPTSTSIGGYMGDGDGHGSNCASIAAGNTCGWAPGAKIYSVRIFSGTRVHTPSNYLAAMSSDICFDLVRAFHLAKIAAATSSSQAEFDSKFPLTGGYAQYKATLFQTLQSLGNVNGVVRPSVCTNSWGYRAYYGSMTKVVWRGTEYSITSYYYGSSYGMVNYQHPYSQIYALNDSADNCSDVGVIMVGAAGNYYHKIDIPGGQDYDNYYKYGTYGSPVYYHAGSSPTCAPSFVTVGAIDNNTGAASERKVYFSESGPRVDVYAPGTSIMGAYANKAYNTVAVSDARNSTYFLNKISGTSQATPQVAGVIACYLQANPSMKVAEIKSMLRRNSTKGALHEGTAGYSNLNHLQGGNNNVLYNPFVEQTRGRIGPA